MRLVSPMVPFIPIDKRGPFQVLSKPTVILRDLEE